MNNTQTITQGRPAPTALLPKPAPSQIAALDGIRGLAALMVILFHGWQVGAFDGLGLGAFSRVAKFGQTGVDLFFVLSGFLITRILIASKDNQRYFRDFYARRTLRIFPLYYFFLIVYLFCSPLVEHLSSVPLKQTWWYWVYLQNIPPTLSNGMAVPGPGHYWSLAVEEHFYFIWPLLVFFVPVRRLFIMSGLLILGALGARWVFVCQLGLTPFYFTFCRMDALALGTLLACIEAQGLLGRLKHVFLASLFILLPVLGLTWVRFSDQGTQWLQILKFTFVGSMYWALLGVAVSYQDAKAVRILFANKPLRFCGKVGYGLYVYQGLLIPLLRLWMPPAKYGPFFLVTVFLVTLAVSWVSFKFFESPFLRLKRFFESGPGPASHASQPRWQVDCAFARVEPRLGP